MIVAVKALHIIALITWCAGLIVLPLLLGRHRASESQSTYDRLRYLTHYSYTRLVTPAAVVAIASGTILIFMRTALTPWLFAKLVAVGALVSLHGLIGHTVVLMSERRGEYQPPSPVLILVGLFLCMATILVLVLAKPMISPEAFPDFMTQPLGRQLPFDETPI
jgi:uncharacterized membrane protein